MVTMLLQKDPPVSNDISIVESNARITEEMDMVEHEQLDRDPVAILGQVMFTLLQANELTWNTTFKRLRQNVKLEGMRRGIGAFADTLAALDYHAALSSLSQRDIFESLIDKILHVSGQHRMTSKRVIQYLLLLSPTSRSFRTFLNEGLATADNRFKMAALCVIDDLTSQWDATPSDQNVSEADGAKLGENTMKPNGYLKAEVYIMAAFIPQCTNIASTSQTASRLSVLASDVVLSLSRSYLHMLTQPDQAHSAQINDKWKIAGIQAINVDQKDTLVRLVSDLISLVHIIKQWLNAFDLQSNVAWHEIETYLVVAKGRLSSNGGERQTLGNLSRFWQVISHSLSWKHVRAKPKTMLKANALGSNTSIDSDATWSYLLGALCSLLIMNGGRYQILVPAQADTVQKLDQPLMDASVKYTKDFLNITARPIGFESVGSDLASLLHHLDGSSSQSLDNYEVKMLRQRLFPQLASGSISYSTCLDIVKRVLSSSHQTDEPLTERLALIHDVYGYIGHANKDMSQLAQTCIVLTLNASPECLFNYIECIRDEASGRSIQGTTTTGQLSPGNLINISKTPDAKDTANLMNVIDQWAQQASKDAWTQILATLVRKAYACRNDKVYTAIWKCISSYIGSDTDLMRIVTTTCVDTMEQQPRLTETMISDSTDEGALAIQDLTFARLCPLLILLAFPESAFSEIVSDVDVNEAKDYWFDDAEPDMDSGVIEQSLSMRLLQALLIRAEHILEIQYVRPVALTVLAGLFGSEGRFLTLCRNKLEKLLKSWKNYHVAIKYWLYGFCVWAKGPWATATHLQATDDELVRELQTRVFSVISQWKDTTATTDVNNDEFKKLKMGAAEANALAQTIITNMTRDIGP
ncbi:hypothetical protein INT43_006893 [Umbelopsis isabellina]|uniref:Uncharacterized protein n=1 Tax=Mortierella isabellina TaxID=91625 RepID=A0A8H7PXA2_MORIS|nr:hypothetical protein INT43_006893 [Umbelopsis isabellina]